MVYDRLVELARNHQLTNYTDIGALIGESPRSKRLRDILDDISCREVDAGGRLLSALVGSKDGDKIRKPGSGFFKMAERTGRRHEAPNLMSDHNFWLEELDRIYRHWSN